MGNPVKRSCARPHACSVNVQLEVLGRARLTRNLDADAHQWISTFTDAFSWQAGESIVLSGDELTGVLLLAAGRGRVVRSTANGDEVTVDIAAPGDILTPVSTSPVFAAESVWAMDTSCALYLPGSALREIIAAYPSIAEVMLTMSQERLHTAREMNMALSTASVEQRVGAVLIYLAEKLSRPDQHNHQLIQARIRREDIAGMAATTVESASRALSKMKKLGMINSGREWISVVDAQALADFSEH